MGRAEEEDAAASGSGAGPSGSGDGAGPSGSNGAGPSSAILRNAEAAALFKDDDDDDEEEEPDLEDDEDEGEGARSTMQMPAEPPGAQLAVLTTGFWWRLFLWCPTERWYICCLLMQKTRTRGHEDCPAVPSCTYALRCR